MLEFDLIEKLLAAGLSTHGYHESIAVMHPSKDVYMKAINIPLVSSLAAL